MEGRRLLLCPERSVSNRDREERERERERGSEREREREKIKTMGNVKIFMIWKRVPEYKCYMYSVLANFQ